MYKYILESVNGVEWFGISALLLFFLTFCTVAIRAVLSGKQSNERMANMPLDD